MSETELALIDIIRRHNNPQEAVTIATRIASELLENLEKEKEKCQS